MKIFFLSMMIFMIAGAPLLASAQAVNPCSIDGLHANNDSISTLPKCINQIYVWSLGLGSLLAVLMAVIGGYYYMTAHGNAEQSGKGIEMIWGAVIGLTLLFGAYLLLHTINPDLVNFQIGSGTCVGPDHAVLTAADQTSCTAQGGTWYSTLNQGAAPTAPHN